MHGIRYHLPFRPAAPRAKTNLRGPMLEPNPPSPRMIDLDHGVTTIDVEYQRVGMAASHLVVDDGRAAFIETGTSRSTPILLEALRRKGIERDQVDWVLVTHVHLDHAGGAGTLMRELPRAKLVVHPRGARHMVDPTQLIAGATVVYGEEEIARTYGEIAPVPAKRVVEAAEGDAIDLGSRTLRFLDTPGHARHHYCVHDEAAEGVFTGDCFGLSYREFDTAAGPWIFPTTTPVQFDPVALHHTIDRLMALAPRYAYLTHFGRVGDLEPLARRLHDTIDREVAIGVDLAGAPERHAAIVSALMDLYLHQLREHGCRLAEADIRDLLALDVDLNAAGLEIWLDKQV